MATEYLDPMEDRPGCEWTPSGCPATDHWQCIDDAIRQPNTGIDGNYLTGAKNDYDNHYYTNPVAQTGTVTAVKVWIYGRTGDANDLFRIQPAGVLDWTPTAVDTAPPGTSNTWVSAEWTSLSIPIADMNALRVREQAIAVGASGGDWVIETVYVELTYTSGQTVTLAGTSAGLSNTPSVNIELLMEFLATSGGQSGVPVAPLKPTRRVIGDLDALSGFSGAVKLSMKVAGLSESQSGTASLISLLREIAGVIDGQSSLTGTLGLGEVFSDGFETGDYTLWNGNATGGGSSLSVQAENPHHGTYASKHSFVSSGWAFEFKNFSTTQYSTIFTRHYWRTSVLPLGNNDLTRCCMLRRLDGGEIIKLIYEKSSTGVLRFRLYNTVTDEDIGTYDVTLSTDTYYSLEVKLVVHATAGEARFYLNGVERIAGTSLNTGSTNFGKFYVGGDYANSDRTDYNDCVVISETYIGLEGQFVFLQGLTEGQAGTLVNLGVAYSVLGDVSGQSGIIVSLGLLKKIIGSLDAQSALTGDLSIMAVVPLSGSLAGQSNLPDADLKLAMKIIGTIDAESATTGAIKLSMELIGDTGGLSSTDAILKAIRGLEGDVDALSTLAGTLQSIAYLLGTVTGTSGADGGLRVTIQLVGVIDGETVVLGNLTQITPYAIDITKIYSVMSDLLTKIRTEIDEKGTKIYVVVDDHDTKIRTER